MTPEPSQQRLVSLDAFRGATIAGMMLVNNPGTWSTIYPQLRHAAWNGWTFTDWIFPFFLWIVGVAMTLSFAKRIEHGADKKKLTLHVIQRSAIIFVLGLLLAAFPFGLLGHSFSLATIRIPGVLQRIAVCYLIAGIIFLNTHIRGQVFWILALLLVYSLLMKLVPVPGYGAGVQEPTGNLAWYLDSTILEGHTWSGAPVPGFDPEGILSTLPAIATTLFGILTGHLVRSKLSKEEKTIWMFVGGNIFLLVGVILDMWFPINKNLWSTSYSVFMAGWALICLGVFYWFIDVKGYKRWAQPFVIYGMNAIAAFMLAGLIGKCLYLIKVPQADGSSQSLQTWIYQTIFLPLASPINASLLYAITFVIVLYLITWIMWRKKWFIKV